MFLTNTLRVAAVQKQLPRGVICRKLPPTHRAELVQDTRPNLDLVQRRIGNMTLEHSAPDLRFQRISIISDSFTSLHGEAGRGQFAGGLQEGSHFFLLANFAARVS